MGDGQTPVDLLSTTGTGPVWGMASNDLNATLLAWPPGHDVAVRMVCWAVAEPALRSSVVAAAPAATSFNADIRFLPGNFF